MALRLAEAEERRKAQAEEKVKQVIERSGIEKHENRRSASAMRRERKFSASMAKRQAQLQEMRDKLKEKHKKNDMVRLKHQLMNNEMGSTMESGLEREKDHFFDD